MRTVTQHVFGGPEVLTIAETERPTPAPGEVLVKVRAIGINPVEAMIRSGGVPILGAPPFTLGWEFSGVVEKNGSGAGQFRPGDEVYGMPMFPRQAGAYAEYVAAPSAMFARKPVSLDHVHAAALPLVALTAWQGLVDYAQLTEGQRVLVHAAGGGVGHIAVQLAKARGAHVIATASAGKHEFVRGLGADEVIDYTAVDFTSVVHGVDVVFDAVGGETSDRSLRVLRPGGTLVTIVRHSDTEFRARVESARLRFVGVGVRPDGAALEKIAELVDGDRLRPHVEQVLPLADVAKAHELIETGHTTGKIVLTP
jgi:NADPH:quinone reductase-like Zn-dependent oxidoreductase